MHAAAHPVPVSVTDGPSPDRVVAAWPRRRPLAALVSVSEPGTDGWSLLACPSAWRIRGRGELGRGPEAVASLRQALHAPADAAGPAAPGEGPVPFGPGWIAALAYELGRSLEPAVDRPAGPLEPPGSTAARTAIPESRDDRHWPDLLLARITGGLAFDHAHGRWWWFGEAVQPVREDLLAAVRMAERGESAPAEPFTILGPEGLSLDDAAHEAAVAAARRAIAAGEIFQANITRRRSLECRGSVRDLAIAALAAGRPRFGAILEAPGGRGLVSMSPELFLDVRRRADGLRVARTRPIKGTLGASDITGIDPGPARLLASEKDAAELAMIVDLMRHDLGRVAIPGGVRVTRPRHVESHATVHHAVAEIEAVLRPEVDSAALLAATFPPGSVTGAPKIRAMQVIDRLEPVRRGPYCGAIGWLGDDGSVRLNVAIRTIAVTAQDTTPRDAGTGRCRIDYASGGGIVADSVPAAERQEADVKVEVFRRTIRALSRSQPDPEPEPEPELQAASD